MAGDIVDAGAPEFVASALGEAKRIDDGWAELSFVRAVTEGGECLRLVKVKLIMPIRAIGPAFDACALAFGLRELMHIAG